MTVASSLLRMVQDPAAPDLSARQIALLALIAAPAPTGHRVKTLASTMNVAKPAVTRGMDRLEQLGMARRAVDRSDRRECLCVIKPAGRAWLRKLEAA